MKNELLSLLKKSSPLLVASLDGDDLPYLLEQARSERADIVEIRLDLWGNFFRDDMLDKMARFKAKIGIPMLVSFRGGHPFPKWWQPVHWRALAHAAMIDVEWNPKYSWRDILKNAGRYNLALMISHHDYTATPTEAKLLKLAKAAYAKKADIVKIATRVTVEEDVRTLLQVSARLGAKKQVAVMGMGPLGTVSRLAMPIFHTCLIYGYIGTPTASGQLSYRDLQERIRALYPHYEEGFQERQARLLSASLV
ncbi:MAG: type I 3-dehydroquinate dehydratase [Elusimicrobiota bacterium]|jgi:3-dehydroquinate dehydratase-1